MPPLYWTDHYTKFNLYIIILYQRSNELVNQKKFFLPKRICWRYLFFFLLKLLDSLKFLMQWFRENGLTKLNGKKLTSNFKWRHYGKVF